MGVSWGKLIFAVTQQAWYYANIYRMADGKAPRPPPGRKVRAGAGMGSLDDGLGVMRAVGINESEGARVTRGLKGIDCHGTHYNPRPRSIEATLMLLLLAVVVLLGVVQWLR